MNAPIDIYPTLSITDPNVLYQSLGSFWNQIFQERGTLIGYTIGQAEEAIQHYYNLIELIHAYSIKDVEILHREKWYPIIIKKSQFDTAPLLFQPDDALFGVQPDSDPYYTGVVFNFGFPKVPSAKVYTFAPPSELAEFSLFANRVLDPSLILINNVDVQYIKGVLYFNKDLFALDQIPKINLLGDNGEPITYKDRNGVDQEEQMIIIWGYHSKLDNQSLFNNFGYIFDIKLATSEVYKEILLSITNLFVEGPTVQAIKSIASAFIGIPSIRETKEVIEDIYTTDKLVIITDKHVYQYDKYYSVLPEFSVGKTVFAGDVLVDAVEYFDQVQVRNWWSTKLSPKVIIQANPSAVPKTQQISFPPHLFVGNNRHAFTFKNEPELVTSDANGNIKFPVHGDPVEIDNFNAYLNLHSTEIRAALGLGVSGAILVNPLDFIFNNFLKHNSALIKFNFKSSDQANVFLAFFKTLRNCIPKHVYFLFYFDFMFDNEVYDKLNNGVTITVDNNPVMANADGSNVDGFIAEEGFGGLDKPPALFLGDNSSIRLDSTFGIFGWVRLKDITVYNPIFHKSGHLFRVYQENNGPFIVEYSGQSISSTIMPNYGIYYAVAVWFDTSDSKLYISVNNELPQFAVITLPEPDSFGPFFIAYDEFTNRSFTGDVRWTGFYKGLSIGYIPLMDSLYNAGVSKKFADLTLADKTDLVSWWNLEDALSTTRIDSFDSNTLLDIFHPELRGKYKVDIQKRLFSVAKSFNMSVGPYIDSGVARFTTKPSALYIANNPTIRLEDSFGYYVWVKLLNPHDLNPILVKSDPFFKIYCHNTFKVEYNGQLIDSGVIPTASTFYFVGAWYDSISSTLNISVNGGTPVTIFALSDIDTENEELLVGYSESINSNMIGELDSLGYYKGLTIPSSLTNTLYNTGNAMEYADLSPGNKTDLISWWDFEEVSGARMDSHSDNHLADVHNNITNEVITLDSPSPIYKNKVVCNASIFDANTMSVNEGRLSINITPGITTRDINNLLLLDFS